MTTPAEQREILIMTAMAPTPAMQGGWACRLAVVATGRPPATPRQHPPRASALLMRSRRPQSRALPLPLDRSLAPPPPPPPPPPRSHLVTVALCAQCHRASNPHARVQCSRILADSCAPSLSHRQPPSWPGLPIPMLTLNKGHLALRVPTAYKGGREPAN